MAITEINDYGVGDTNFTSFMETLDSTRRGLAQITIDEYDTTAAPDVKVGSVFENNGSLYQVETADETPTGYSGISNSTTFYLYYDESEGEFVYSETAPTWSDSKQGWYHPTNVNDRAFFSMYKDSGGTLYERKRYLIHKSTDWRVHEIYISESKLTIGQELELLIPTSQDFISCLGQLKDSTIDSGLGCSIRGIVNNGSNNMAVIYNKTSDGSQAVATFNSVSGTGTFDYLEIKTDFQSIT